jgi:hypothetical protein
MKIPKAFGAPVALDAFTTPIKAREDAVPSKWWLELSDEAKAEYVKEHPGSKYADFHAQEQAQKTKPPTDEPVKPKQPEPKKEMKPETPAPKPKAKPDHKGARPSGIRDHSAPAPKPEHKAEVPKLGLKDFSHPDMKPGSGKRKALAAFLKKKSSHIISHIKHEGKEWKTAGSALKGLAQGKGMTPEGKKALGTVAADLATVTLTIAAGGGAAHGIAAFLHHFGAHLAQDVLVKAAIKGVAGGAAHHASVMVLSSEEDQILEEAVKMMLEILENGDLEELAKKFGAEAAKEGKGHEVKKDFGASTLTASIEIDAKLDMSAQTVGAGLCPECKSKMTIAKVGGSPSWVCAQHRISLPLPDDHDYYKQEGSASMG